MDAIAIDVGAALAATLVVLVLGAALVAALTGVERSRVIVSAAVRATVQLGLVSLVIAAVVKSAGWTALFLAFMFCVAVLTSARRITRSRAGLWTAVPLAAGVVPVVTLLVLTGVLPTEGITLVPIAGILLGAGMVATSLAGRRLLDELRQRWDEVEAALSLGAQPRVAFGLVARPVAREALVPTLDQTRTVGLVTLPGTFVGLLLGGASPLEAGAAQLLVLVSAVAVQVVAVAVTVELVTRGYLRRPADYGDIRRRRRHVKHP